MLNKSLIFGRPVFLTLEIKEIRRYMVKIEEIEKAGSHRESNSSQSSISTSHVVLNASVAHLHGSHSVYAVRTPLGKKNMLSDFLTLNA